MAKAKKDESKPRVLRTRKRRDDVLDPLLGSAGDLWVWCILWRDVAKHERFEGIDECPGCACCARAAW